MGSGQPICFVFNNLYCLPDWLTLASQDQVTPLLFRANKKFKL